MTEGEARLLIDDGGIRYRRIFAKIGGGATAGLLLSQAWYWKDKTDDPDGFFWKTEKQWEDETGLTRTEQETARKHLRKAGLITEKKRGMPAKLHYKVNENAVIAAVISVNNTECGKPADKDAENLQTDAQYAGKPQASMQESRTQERGKPADKDAENLQTIKEHKTTSETTSETTPSIRRAATPLLVGGKSATGVSCEKCGKPVEVSKSAIGYAGVCSQCNEIVRVEKPPPAARVDARKTVRPGRARDPAIETEIEPLLLFLTAEIGPCDDKGAQEYALRGLLGGGCKVEEAKECLLWQKNNWTSGRISWLSVKKHIASWRVTQGNIGKENGNSNGSSPLSPQGQATVRNLQGFVNRRSNER